MAARQDQTLVIALIVFVCIAVVGLAWGYLMFKSSSDANKQLADMQSRLKSETDALRNKEQENESLRTFMGAGASDSFTSVQTTYTEDMESFGSTFEESRRNYRDILEYVYQESQKLANNEAEAKEQVRQLKERLLATEGEKEQQIKQIKAQMEEAAADLARQTNAFKADRDKLEATKQELMESQAEQKQFYLGQLKERDTRIEELTKTLGNNESALEKLLAERTTNSESFEVPDGRVSWVNQDGTVWINLGAADALRRQIIFSVYDADEHDPAKAAKKGSLEVTQVLGDHIAEARVTSDSATNPILAGDYIYSQVWHRGKQLRFALTGFIDVDGDDISDLKKARDLIALNGGVVDAYIDDQGEQQGEVTVDTRYLVLGEFPTDPLRSDYLKYSTQMAEDAEQKGVEVITLTEFLNHMGYRPEERTIRPGDSSTVSFDAENALQSDATSKFRRRTPYKLPSKTPF